MGSVVGPQKCDYNNFCQSCISACNYITPTYCTTERHTERHTSAHVQTVQYISGSEYVLGWVFLLLWYIMVVSQGFLLVWWGRSLMAKWLRMSISEICNVQFMIQRSWVWTLVKSNLGHIVLLFKVSLETTTSRSLNFIMTRFPSLFFLSFSFPLDKRFCVYIHHAPGTTWVTAIHNKCNLFCVFLPVHLEQVFGN